MMPEEKHMNSDELWSEFYKSGRVDKYLMYAESKTDKAVKKHGADENKRFDNKDNQS